MLKMANSRTILQNWRRQPSTHTVSPSEIWSI